VFWVSATRASYKQATFCYSKELIECQDSSVAVACHQSPEFTIARVPWVVPSDDSDEPRFVALYSIFFFYPPGQFPIVERRTVFSKLCQ
jgi:hypothetical protein